MTVQEVTQKVKQGYRMTFPTGTDIEIITMVTLKCWSDKASERYTMREIRKFWERAYGIRRRNSSRHRVGHPSVRGANISTTSSKERLNTKRRTEKMRGKKTALRVD